MARGLGRPLAIAAFLMVLVGAAGPAHNEAVANRHDGPLATNSNAPEASTEAVASWAGFGGVAVTEMLSQRLGLPDAAGVIVTFVHPEGPAAKAGLQTRDVILRAGDESIDDGAGWSEWVSEQVPGTRIALIVQRQGEELSFPLTIEELPDGVEPDGR
jgi:S1-C subfamily serine protease